MVFSILSSSKMDKECKIIVSQALGLLPKERLYEAYYMVK